MEYLIHLAILVCIYLILAQAFNLPFGVGQLFNLAHVSAYAIGAYVTALLSTEHGWAFIPAMEASVAVAAIASLIVGGIALKLSNDSFAIGTLAFSAVVSALLVNWKSLTRGVLGIPGIPRPTLGSIDFYQNTNFLILAIICAVLAQIVGYIALKGAFGRRLASQAQYPQAAAALGINGRLVNNISFVISSALAGLAGSLYAYYINYIDPSSFMLNEMIFILTIVIVGRPGSFWGIIGTTFFLVLLPEPLRFVEMPSSILGPLRQLLYALILFSVVYIRRQTLFPVLRSI